MLCQLYRLFCFVIRNSCTNYPSDTRSFILSTGALTVQNCVFSRSSTYSGDGSVIYYSGNSQFTLKESSFYKCCSSSSGGAIIATSNDLFFYKVCARECKCLSYGEFSFISNTGKGEFSFVSMLYCSDDNNGNYPVYMQGGNQIFGDSNSSYNYVAVASGFCFDSPSQLSVTYSSFSNNRATSRICVYFHRGSGNRNMEKCNIINNNSPTGGVVISNYGGDYTLNDCIMIDNIDKVLCAEDATLRVNSCYIYHSGDIYTGNVIFANLQLIKTAPFPLTHFYTYYCQAEANHPMIYSRNSIKRGIFVSLLFTNLLCD